MKPDEENACIPAAEAWGYFDALLAGGCLCSVQQTATGIHCPNMPTTKRRGLPVCEPCAANVDAGAYGREPITGTIEATFEFTPEGLEFFKQLPIGPGPWGRGEEK